MPAMMLQVSRYSGIHTADLSMAIPQRVPPSSPSQLSRLSALCPTGVRLHGTEVTTTILAASIASPPRLVSRPDMPREFVRRMASPRRRPRVSRIPVWEGRASQSRLLLPRAAPHQRFPRCPRLGSVPRGYPPDLSPSRSRRHPFRPANRISGWAE